MVAKHGVVMCACVLLAASRAMAEPAPLAEIIATEPAEAGISVTVPTGGCTEKADFDIRARAAASGAADIEIRRLKPDDCKGNFPAGLKLLFTWSDLKLSVGTKLVVKNPVEARTYAKQGIRDSAPDTSAKQHVKHRHIRSKHRRSTVHRRTLCGD